MSTSWYVPFHTTQAAAPSSLKDDFGYLELGQNDKKNLPASSASRQPVKITTQCRSFWTMAAPYFRENSKGRWLFVGLIVLMLFNSAVQLLFSFWMRDFWSALSNKGQEAFY
jgi:ABC-type uncharacterized transport system fused permease/ATPase subunit